MTISTTRGIKTISFGLHHTAERDTCSGAAAASLSRSFGSLFFSLGDKCSGFDCICVVGGWNQRPPPPLLRYYNDNKNTPIDGMHLRLTLDNWERVRNKSFEVLRRVAWLLWGREQKCTAAGHIIHMRSFGTRPLLSRNSRSPAQTDKTRAIPMQLFPEQTNRVKAHSPHLSHWRLRTCSP